MGQRNPAPPMVETLWPSTVYLTAKGTHSPDSPTNLDGQTAMVHWMS